MSGRDELVVILHRRIGSTVGETVDDILAAGYSKPRTITTAEELDALPVGSVVLDPTTWLFRKREDGRYAVAGSAVGYTSATIDFPATVLHEATP